MKPLASLLLVLLAGLPWPAAAGPHAVVLIAGAASPVTELEPVAVRKLFLGFPVLVQGEPLHPIRNRTDAQLDQIFLQQIVAMSQSAYDRQILAGMLRQGRLRPVDLKPLEQVLAGLRADTQAVSFAWLRDVEHDPNIKILRVLWDD